MDVEGLDRDYCKLEAFYVLIVSEILFFKTQIYFSGNLKPLVKWRKLPCGKSTNLSSF
jgi:hypothetical protein